MKINIKLKVIKEGSIVKIRKLNFGIISSDEYWNYKGTDDILLYKVLRLNIDNADRCQIQELYGTRTTFVSFKRLVLI